MRRIRSARTLARAEQIAASDRNILTKQVRYDGDEITLSAFVASSSGWDDRYRTSVCFEDDSGIMLDYSCTCPADREHDGMCKHCAALMLSYSRAPAAVPRLPGAAHAHDLGLHRGLHEARGAAGRRAGGNRKRRHRDDARLRLPLVVGALPPFGAAGLLCDEGHLRLRRAHAHGRVLLLRQEARVPPCAGPAHRARPSHCALPRPRRGPARADERGGVLALPLLERGWARLGAHGCRGRRAARSPGRSGFRHGRGRDRRATSHAHPHRR